MKSFISLGFVLMAVTLFALPKPETTGGMPLREALMTRKSVHRVAGKQRPTEQQLSNLLWCANGVTREDGKRTAPSAMDRREIQIFVLTEDGLSRYDAVKNELKTIDTSDKLTALRKQASMILFYTFDKTVQSKECALTDVGFVGQNVYLYCTSEGWQTVFVGTVDRKLVAQVIGCAEDEVLYAQRIGIQK